MVHVDDVAVPRLQPERSVLILYLRHDDWAAVLVEERAQLGQEDVEPRVNVVQIPPIARPVSRDILEH